MTSPPDISGAPDALVHVACRVNAKLAKKLAEEKVRWTQISHHLEEPIDDLTDLVLRGGKRIRPAYCYWGWILGNSALDSNPTLENGNLAVKETRRHNSAIDDTHGHLAELTALHSFNSGNHTTGDFTTKHHSIEHHDSEHHTTDNHTTDDAGCALELLHAFALAHDDVMDASTARRGTPSVWCRFIQRHQQRAWHGEGRRFGESAAILVGNLAMVLADNALGDVTVEARHVWNTLRAELNMGQYLDMVGAARNDVDESEAHTIIEHKTARYTVVRPLQLGAALAGRTDIASSLARYGKPIGIAFQLRDDVLGAFGDPSSTGKSVGEDLRENKPTLMMALARKTASASQLKILNATARYTTTHSVEPETVAAAQQVLVDTGALAAVEQEITRLLSKSLQAIEHLPANTEASAALTDLAHYMVNRNN